MKKQPLLIVLIAATLLCTFSCNNNSGSSDLMIPKEAAMVVHIDNSSLSSKLSWKEIQASNWFKEASSGQEDSVARKMLENPEASGIDTKKDMAFFIQKLGKTGLAVFQGKLEDAEEFEKFNTYILKQSGKEVKSEKNDDLNFISLGENSLVSWDGSTFSYVAEVPIFSYLSKPSYDYENEGNDENDEKSFNPDSLKAYTKSLYNLSGSKSLASDDRFSDLLKQEGDVHFWINSEKYYEAFSSSMYSVMSMLKISALFDGAAYASTLSFDDGMISVKTKQYLSDEVAKILEKHPAKEVSKDMINRIPSKNVIGALALNYPSESVRDLLKLTGLDGAANAFLGRIGYSMDELLKAYKGDMLVAVSDLSVTKKEVKVEGTDFTYTNEEPKVHVLFALSVKDKPSFEKLMRIAEEQLKQEGAPTKDVSYKLSNEWFAAGNSPEQVDNFLSGGNNNHPFASKISGHPIGVYIDIQKIITSSKTVAESETGLFDVSEKMWQDLVITGGDYKKGVSSSELVINLVDKKTNSLKQLNQYLDNMAAAEKKRVHDDDVHMPSDSTAVIVPLEPNN